MMRFVILKKFPLPKKSTENEIPDVYYAVYQNIIAINHFKNEAYFFCHSFDGNNNISEIEQLLQSRNIASLNSQKKEKELQI